MTYLLLARFDKNMFQKTAATLDTNNLCVEEKAVHDVKSTTNFFLLSSPVLKRYISEV